MDNSISDIPDQIRQAAAGLKLGDGVYGLIRRGTNDVFVDKQSGVVARVAPDYISQAEIEAKLLDCIELAAAGAPVLGPLIDRAVVLSAGRHVSFWPQAEVGPEPDGREMAETMVACHRLSPPARLSDWTPDLYVDRRWETLKMGINSGLPADIANHLSNIFTEALEKTKDMWNELCGSYKTSFIHGDTHHSNFVRYRGRLVLCDPDNICRGPREKDLANIWECSRRHYINPEYWGQFVSSYSLDYNQNLLDILTRVQEIGGCMWMVQFWGSRPDARPAIINSIETIDQPDAKWLDF